MEHSKILDENRNRLKSFSNKTLLSRALGKFYTPAPLTRILVDGVISNFNFCDKQQVSIIDPFCGDGRLIVGLIDKLAEAGISPNLEVTLWDCDEEAIAHARSSVTEASKEYPNEVRIVTYIGDSFRQVSKKNNQYDIVATNPPWEVLRPDSRELKLLSNSDREKFVARLKKYDEWLSEVFPISQPARKMFGWGTNLARVGTEAALRITKSGGVCGVVSPATLFGDQMSSKLREWLLTEHDIKTISYFPAEARLFNGVDQPTAIFIAAKDMGRSHRPSLSVYAPDLVIKSHGTVTLDSVFIESNDYSIPIQYGPDGISFLSQFAQLNTLGSLKSNNGTSLWTGREVDETEHKKYLKQNGDYLFVKGRMVSRFGMVEMPAKYLCREGLKIPKSANHSRIAWRDVSRPTQQRRLQATIIPPKWVAGNSLNVAYFKDGCDKKLHALLAVMNSIVFEMQLKARLATSHVSLGIVRQLFIPCFDNEDMVLRLAKLAKDAICTNQSASPALEVEVAKAYGITRSQFSLILSFFDKMTIAEKEELLSNQRWQTAP